MNIDQILRRGDKMAAETAAVIRRGEELVAKLESGDVKPEDPQVKEILFQLKERVAQDCAGNNGCGLFVSAPMPGILKHKITFD